MSSARGAQGEMSGPLLASMTNAPKMGQAPVMTDYKTDRASMVRFDCTSYVHTPDAAAEVEVPKSTGGRLCG